jgi:hypothetical protein
MLISYVVSASRLVGSNPFAHFIVIPVGGVTVRTVGVEPEVNVTSMHPDAGATIVSVEHSPQMYRTPAFAVMDGVVPLTVSGASSISAMADFADSVYTPTALDELLCVLSPAAFAKP